MSRFVVAVFLTLGAATSLGSMGCGASVIPNTDVPDTGDNRSVVDFCEQYRKAVEEKNVGLILKMTHPSYHEDGGNADGTDDLDFNGFKDYLTTTFAKTESIRHEVRYRRISVTQTHRFQIDYTFTASFKIPGVKGDEWKNVVADNRLELVRSGESYKIISGM